jgi:type IV pilus assembly protein PilM
MAGEKFCGACGANLAEVVKQQLENCEQQLREAVELQRAYRYEEAAAVLTLVSRQEHFRLQPYARRAVELLQAMSAERQRAQEHLQMAYEEGQRRMAEGDCQGVVELLGVVPDHLRTAPMAGLLEEAKARLAEISLLDAQIRAAVADNRVADLLPKVDRLLVLQPGHAVAQKLAGKFRDHLIKLARNKGEGFQYEAALQLLEQVPRGSRNEDWDAEYRRLSELAWLSWDLRNAPAVTSGLTALAERLQRLSPKDPKATTALDELRRRATAGPKDSTQMFVPWAAAPQSTPLGFPVDWLTGFKRIKLRDEMDRSPLVEHAGCFFVAIGLALQGLGRATMKTNLIPSERSVKGAVNQLWRMRPTRAAWGFDLSSSGLKAVRLSLDAQDHGVVLEACDFIEHKKLLSQAANDEEEKLLIEESVRTFHARNDTKGCRLCMALPGRMLLIRQLRLPPLEEAKMANVLQFEARRQFSFPLDDLAWGHEALERVNSESKEIAIALIAAKRLQIKDRLARLGALGLVIDLVQADCFALHNFLEFEFYGNNPTNEPTGDDVNQVTAVLDLGSETSQMLVTSPKLKWFHNIGLGSQSLTKVLVRELQLTAAQAEQIKRAPAAAESLHVALPAMNSVFEEFVKEIQEALELFQKQYRHKRVSRLLGVGGGFQIHGLFRYLRVGR